MAITIDGTNGLSSDNAALKLDGTTLAVDETNNRVGVGTASPAVAMDVVGQVRASTGILFGSDTAAANALDDYEEGTWTAAWNFSTSGSATMQAGNGTGSYTKIGNVVYFEVNIATASISSPTGEATITGLPFAGVTGVSGAFISLKRRWATDMPNLTVNVTPTNIRFPKNATNVTTLTYLQGSDFSASANYNTLYIVGFYYV